MTKKLVYLMVLTASINASVFSIELAGVQMSIFRGIVIIISIIMLLELILVKKKISLRNNTDNRFSLLFMIIWLLYALCTLAWVKDYGAWLKAIYFLTLGLLLIVIFIRYMKTEYDILILFKMMAIMAYIHNIIGWFEVFTGNYLFLKNSHIVYALHKYPASMFGNTNNFATYMLFSIFILYLNGVSSKNKVFCFINMGFILSSLYLITMTNSRAVFLGLIMAISTFILLSIKNSEILSIINSKILSIKNSKILSIINSKIMSVKNRKIHIILLIIFMISFILVIVTLFIFSNINLLIENNNSFRFSTKGSSDSIRFNLIKNGIYFFISTFGLGTGAGNIEYWMSHYSKYHVADIVNIHNWWLEILVGYGLIIFIMYIIFYIKLLLSMYKKIKYGHDNINKVISIIIISCMSGYIIGSISSSSNFNSEWLWVFWATAISYQGIKTINK